MVLTGLPVVVLDFIEKYPVLTLGVFLLILLIRVASRRVKEQAQEYAFQAWRRTGNSARPASPPAQPTRWVRIATAVLEPVSAVVLIGCVGLVGLIVSWPPPTQAAGAANDRAACADTRGDCRLAPGESMLVTLRADQPRNETGLMLEQGETYTARFIANVGWRDASKEPTPEGFASFERRLGIPRFIWTRWRRPLPEGRSRSSAGSIANLGRSRSLRPTTPDAARIHRTRDRRARPARQRRELRQQRRRDDRPHLPALIAL